MKRLLYLLAAVSLLFTACKKENLSQSDIVGAWEDALDECVYTFNEDGSYTQAYEGSDPRKGTWTLEGGKLTLSIDNISVGAKLFGEKAAMVWDYRASENDPMDFIILTKKGATIKQAATLPEGRWDAPHMGVKPDDENSELNDYTLCFVSKGGTLDMYVLAWGFHVQGKYSIADGHLKFDSPKMWQGIYRHDSYKGWSAYGPPYDGAPGYNADGEPLDGVANMNPQTFEIKSAWSVEEGDPLNNWAPMSDILIIVDGDNAYVQAAGLRKWAYKTKKKI